MLPLGRSGVFKQIKQQQQNDNQFGCRSIGLLNIILTLYKPNALPLFCQFSAFYLT
jgi:hypothetical protein